MKITRFLGIVVLAMIYATPSLQADDGEKVTFEEPFASKLSEGWSWVRESPLDWRVENAVLDLHTLPGYLHANMNNSRNILLRAVPERAPLAVEVLVEGDPKVQYEHAGLVWYHNDDNYIALFQEALGGKTKLQIVTEKDGKPKFSVAPYDGKTVWLRLQVTAGKITGQFRATEKDKWENVGEGEIPLGSPAKVGLMAGGAPEKSERRVLFRNFRILETK